MARGTPALIGWLVAATATLVALFSIVVLLGDFAPESEDGDRPGVVRQFFNSLLHAMDPGTVAGDEGKWPFLALMLLLTIGGLLIVSALIGVLATGLDRKINELRKGRSVVLERDHTLVLGWSETVFTVLGELAIANENEHDPSVVILSERDRVEMEDLIRVKVPDLRNTRVICRTGSPVDLTDLQVASPGTARAVIILSPEGDDDPDAQVIKTILALTRSPQRREEPYRIVAEIHDPSNMEAARLVGGDEAVLVDKRETISRLLVQSSRQKGASLVYNDLLDFEGDEVYMHRDPGLEGRTFGDALLAYEDCCVIGLRTFGRVALNPPADTEILPGSEIVAIAEDDSRLAAAAPCVAEVDEDAIVSVPRAPDEPARVLVLGFNGRTPTVINEFARYLAPGSSVRVVASVPVAADVVERECSEYGDLEVSVSVGSTTDRRTLEGLGVEGFDHVIVMPYADQLDHQRADARTLVTLLHLRDIIGSGDRNGSGPTLTSEMLDDRNRELAQVTRVDDVIVSDRILSLMLTQLSENERLAAVFGELFAAEGSEVYLRPAGEYVVLGREVSFATVVEAARRRGEVALGFRDPGESDEPLGFQLNPTKSTRVAFSADDRVIVLAEE
ncbi:MAG: potassium transporter TrkA [Actinomycetota bacterium]|nr:potassium transporter TrkA [Actinomycetota bacterium]